MQIDVVSLFPGMFQAITQFGVSQRALNQRIWSLSIWNPRDFTHDHNRRVDDRPYGGGPGMVMQAEPLTQAISAARQRQAEQGISSPVVYLSPQGQIFNHHLARKLSQRPGLILLCGRYEGIDERLIEHSVDEEISLGDYVLSGGELPAMMLMDTVIRLLPGVLNDQRSAAEDSFAQGLLDYPHYTRPAVCHNRMVPKPLLSGNHAQITKWRLKQSLGRTWQRRPDLLQQRMLTQQEAQLLAEYQQEQAFRNSRNSNDESDSTT